MPSSIFSSERIAASPFGLVARWGAAPSIVAIFILAGFGAWRRAHPSPSLTTMENVVVHTQIERSHSIGRTDVLFLGDSSALMGVAPLQVSRALEGKSTESLATIGFMGPRGYGQLLDNYTSRGNPVDCVVILLHPASLVISEDVFREGRYEQTVLSDKPPVDGLILTEGRRQIFANVIDRAVMLPFPGSYGKAYGWPDEAARVIHDERGSLTDPHQLDNTAYPGPGADFSAAVVARLPHLRAALERAKPSQLWIGITPMPERYAISSAMHRQSTLRLAQALASVPHALEELPSSLPDRYFATITHLNAEGRALYSDRIARLLLTRARRAEH